MAAANGRKEGKAEARVCRLPIDIEDEVSWVIHEFKRQGSPIHSIEKGNGGNRMLHNKTSKKRPYPGYFSDIRYYSTPRQNTIESKGDQTWNCAPRIGVAYLFDKVLSLKFHIYIRQLNHSNGNDSNCGGNKNHYETFVTFEDEMDEKLRSKELWKNIKQRICSICESLNDNHSGKQKSSSLFATLSKLLMLLNQLQAQVLAAENATKNQDGYLFRALSNREKNLHLARLLENESSCCSGGVDLAILLLRCAAMGMHADVFSYPFPPADGPITERIWNATKDYQRFGRRRKTLHLTKTANGKSAFHPSEHLLLGFLCSLPWMKRGKIKARQATYENAEPEQRDARRILVEVCLELDENSDDSSYSPRFARSCHKHGSLTVFHGTKIENAWSILHNGFFNPSEVGRGGNEFVKHGAMLGSGVYLTTSQKVATHFATSDSPTRAVKSALKHDALTSLLCMATGENNLLEMQNEKEKSRRNQRTLLLDDLHGVSCFAVFEARIILPPEINKDSPVTSSSNQNLDTENVNRNTRRDGKYYVVPDGRDIRITKLHLTFELTRKHRGTANFVTPKKRFMGTGLVLALLGLIVAFALGSRI